MNGIYLVYFLLGILLCFGAKLCPRGEWNEEYTSRDQTKILTGIMTMAVALHHLAQKTCAPWLPGRNQVHGLDFFINIGFPVVAVFLFCSGLGLYRSLHSKPDYLKGFFRKRVLRIVIAFYLSEWIYTAVRLLMGEKMNWVRILWYLSGLHMANTYSWYVIVIPFFYLAFWAAFRICRKHEGLAIFWVFVFTLAYTVLGAFIDHQNDWWMRGEWWYNSIILFPLGLLFGRFEKPVTRFFRKGYWICLLLAAAAVVLLYLQSDFLVNRRWGYYREGMRMKVPFRLYSAGSQWLVCIAFTAFCFLLMMKVRFGNRALAWLGAMSLEVYLMHGLFVELFGFSFLDVAKSLAYIKNVPLYMLAVLACTVPAALGFRWLCRKVYSLFARPRKPDRTQSAREGEGRVPEKVRRLQAKYQAEASASKAVKIIRICLFPVLFLALGAVMFFTMKNDSMRTVNGLKITPPEGYTQRFSDSRYEAWEYSGDKMKPGRLVLDTEIKGSYAQSFSAAEDVLADCTWLREAEVYTNPQGIRMVRGFDTDKSGCPERRYYVESGGSMFLLSMIEDSRYYSVDDCEKVMKQTADSIRR